MARMTTRSVAERFGVTPHTVRDWVVKGWLRGVTASGGHGRGQRMYFDSGEVDAFEKNGGPAAQAYRESQTLPPRRRRSKASA